VPITVALPLVFLVAFAVGAALRHPLVIVPLAAVWPLYFVGLIAGFWGWGTGDGWVAVAAFLTVASTAGGLAGLACGWLYTSGGTDSDRSHASRPAKGDNPPSTS
jgi:hypothetical protein